MDDFACLIATTKEFPGFAFRFKSLHAPVLVRDLAMPKRQIRAVGGAIYAVGLSIHLSLRLPADSLPRSEIISYSIF